MSMRNSNKCRVLQ